ncbi:YPQ2 Probable vacuolar amino acid transporter YPQ2 [Candida maltosa Xu316]
MSTCSSSFLLISSTFSFVSCTSWIFAQLPQIYQNYSTKSASGISPSFLILWFMGDFLSFTSCLVNSDVVLGFQLYLSIFFLCNDITLCFQYYYYNNVYPRKHVLQYVSLNLNQEDDTTASKDISIHQAQSVHHLAHSNMGETISEDYVNSTPSSYDSVHEDGNNTNLFKKGAVGTLLHASKALALPIGTPGDDPITSKSSLGLFLAWGCTVVYCSSRCPQLYKNYQRKSVEGISPLLFASALMGNLTYTLSILTSCDFVYGENSHDFIIKELPYILGSSGTIIFDIAYFYQKYLYRNNGQNTNTMTLESWSEIEARSSNNS